MVDALSITVLKDQSQPWTLNTKLRMLATRTSFAYGLFNFLNINKKKFHLQMILFRIHELAKMCINFYIINKGKSCQLCSETCDRSNMNNSIDAFNAN